MKKDGFFASLLTAVVENQKKKYANSKPDIVYNQKKQLWYMMMNEIDKEPEENHSEKEKQE